MISSMSDCFLRFEPDVYLSQIAKLKHRFLTGGPVERHFPLPCHGEQAAAGVDRRAPGVPLEMQPLADVDSPSQTMGHRAAGVAVEVRSSGLRPLDFFRGNRTEELQSSPCIIGFALSPLWRRAKREKMRLMSYAYS